MRTMLGHKAVVEDGVEAECAQVKPPGNMDEIRTEILSTDYIILLLGRPMSCMPGYVEVINTHTVGSLTIPTASIKWV